MPLAHRFHLGRNFLAALRSDCRSMLFLDLKDFEVFDTSTVYGQSRSGTVAVAVWLCGYVEHRFGAWIIRPLTCAN